MTVANETHALEAQGLKLAWDSSMVVVDNLSLAVDKGEIICLVGKSGCGKSTVLHALAGLTTPLAGHVYVGGEEKTGQPGSVSYMLQKDLLLPNLSVLDNASLPLVLGGMNKAEAREKARSFFAQFGLEGTEDDWPSELSGGMRQRAAFLRTYLMGNEVVLLDEPFSALDAITRTEIRRWFCWTARELGMAVIAITHDPDEAVSMADRVLVLAGDPQGGVPSHITREIEVDRSVGTGMEFTLTEGFINAKRAVLESLA